MGEGEGEVCGGRRRVVGEGVWWAKARACGGRRRTRGGERGTNEGAKSVDGRRSETEAKFNINIEHVDVELLHVTLRLSASRDVST